MVETQTREFTKRQFAGLLVGASVGSMFEWYDFFLAATAAAVVWPTIFFPSHSDPGVALTVSLASLGVGFLGRPVGAVVFGHFGDRYGRRTTMVSTMVLMGIASLATALLPPYTAIGMVAVAMVFVLRFLMGIGVGGETGGAFAWIAEARPNSKHRGFWVSWPNAVLQLGILLSLIAFYVVSSSLSRAALLDWGWRVPFVIGTLLLVIAVLIRVKVMESPMFQQLQVKRSVLKFPAFEVLKEEWRKILTMLWMDFYIAATASFVILPYSVSYLTNLGVNPAFASASVGAGNAAAFFVILGAAYLSDYVGRLKILRLGAILSILTIFPYFFLLQTLNPIWIIAAQIMFYSICEIPAGSNKVLYTESFSTKYRYSGSGLTYQLAGLCSGIVMALVFPTIVLVYGVLGAWQPIVWVSIAMAIPSLIASVLVKETKGIALE